MNLTRLRRPRRTARFKRSDGQSLVEFAMILPLMLIILLAIVDMARIYTTMITVESAVREAADYGAFHWWRWQPAARSDTEAEMIRRACIAAGNLPDYEESGGVCTNPTVTVALTRDPTNLGADCEVRPTQGLAPCRVTATAVYTFHLFAPLHLSLFGTDLGLPSTLTFTRDSTFAVSDFGVDVAP